MPISWNEIRHNAIKFSREWAGIRSESAEKQTFWNEFFQVFGIKRRVVASFEEPVKKISGAYGYIDLFWPGMLLVEHKSFGQMEEGGVWNSRATVVDNILRVEVSKWNILSCFRRMLWNHHEAFFRLTNFCKHGRPVSHFSCWLFLAR
jgi:hypothetical protein